MPNEHELILMIRPLEEPDPNITGNFEFNVSVDTVKLLWDLPIVTVLEGVANTVSGLLISAEAICQRAGFLLGAVTRP
jgi:hypothetical protein